MAGKNVKPDDTAVILKNFAIIFPLFYIAYYAITGILSAIVGISRIPNLGQQKSSPPPVNNI